MIEDLLDELRDLGFDVTDLRDMLIPPEEDDDEPTWAHSFGSFFGRVRKRNRKSPSS